MGIKDKGVVNVKHYFLFRRLWITFLYTIKLLINFIFEILVHKAFSYSFKILQEPVALIFIQNSSRSY